MDKVRLMTDGGDYIVSGSIPKFNEPPGVLSWGARFFTYDVTDDENVHVYVETFAVALIQTD
jgi:hypothetical protein